jgi:hypothetical protein
MRVFLSLLSLFLLCTGCSSASELKGIHLFGHFPAEFVSLNGSHLNASGKYYEIINQDLWETKDSNPEIISIVTTAIGVKNGDNVCFEIDALFGDLLIDLNENMLDFDESIKQAKWQNNLMRICKNVGNVRSSEEISILELGEIKFDDLNSKSSNKEQWPFKIKIKILINKVADGNKLIVGFTPGD